MIWLIWILSAAMFGMADIDIERRERDVTKSRAKNWSTIGFIYILLWDDGVCVCICVCVHRMGNGLIRFAASMGSTCFSPSTWNDGAVLDSLGFFWPSNARMMPPAPSPHLTWDTNANFFFNVLSLAKLRLNITKNTNSMNVKYIAKSYQTKRS